MKQNLDLNSITPRLKETLRAIRRYYGIAFFMVLACIYAFLLFQIDTFVNATPDESTIKADTAKKLKVDEDIAKQLQELRDNSTNVQAIPNENRANPFQE
jgi:predicted transcriptional regulator